MPTWMAGTLARPLNGSRKQKETRPIPHATTGPCSIVKSRALPTSDIEIAHRSTNTCHLGNIALKVGRKLAWDTETETFKNDPEANALLSREPRKGFELPNI
ncbi:MAG: hypothetical protein WBX00_25410 [Isosphaeraceae bacterium]